MTATSIILIAVAILLSCCGGKIWESLAEIGVSLQCVGAVILIAAIFFGVGYFVDNHLIHSPATTYPLEAICGICWWLYDGD